MATQPEAMNVSGAVSRGGRPPIPAPAAAVTRDRLTADGCNTPACSRPPTTIPPGARPPPRATHAHYSYSS